MDSIMVALISAGSAISVALITIIGNAYLRRRDDIKGKLDSIEQKMDKVSLGTMTSLKSDLQQLHERQSKYVSDKNMSWSADTDRIFNETYVAYKQLGGNGIIDRLKQDMDIWHDQYAQNAFGAGK